MGAKLVAEEGILKGLVLSLDDGSEWTIGRDPESCDLLIEDPSASRKHLICKASSKGILVENLSTTNPIKVNNEEIHTPQLLVQGDALTIGSGIFRFYQDEEAHIWTEEEEEAEIKAAPVPEEAIEEEAAPFADEPFPEEQALKEEELPSRESIFEEAEAGMPAPELATITFDISETGRWLLKVVSGPNSGAEFAMQTKHSYLIGTDPNSCDIVFHDNSVSRQHARITITPEDKVMIEDTSSRNGTLVDGEKLQGTKSLETNMLVSLGTSSFVIFDREGEMQTIISPLLPSIVKTLKEENKAAEAKQQEEGKEKPPATQAPLLSEAPKKVKEPTHSTSLYILMAIVIGVISLAGIGVTTLFMGDSVEVQAKIDYDAQIKTALAPFKNIRYQFSESTGSLLLIGHVLKASDKTTLRNIVDEIPFVKHIDDKNVVIDEQIWREINQVLARNPSWKGITIQAQEPGHFVITGYLQTRDQSEELWDYLNGNFPFLDMLEKRIIVEENVIKDVNNRLEVLGFGKVLVTMSQGELTLAGTIPQGQKEKYQDLVKTLEKIPGLTRVRSFVQEISPVDAVTNISDEYEVSGFSRKGNVNTGVVINGRILGVSDKLDGMTITEIGENYVLLKKDGLMYRIDYK